MNEGGAHSIKHKHETQKASLTSRGSLKRGAKLLQSLTEHTCCEFILHMRGGSQCSQPIWIGDAVAKHSCNARRTRFLENNPVAAVLDYTATTFRRNECQAVLLRFELGNSKSVRKGLKNEYD